MLPALQGCGGDWREIMKNTGGIESPLSARVAAVELDVALGLVG